MDVPRRISTYHSAADPDPLNAQGFRVKHQRVLDSFLLQVKHHYFTVGAGQGHKPLAQAFLLVILQA